MPGRPGKVHVYSGPRIANSDQGRQFSSYDWQNFLNVNNLTQSMSSYWARHGIAAADFFQLLKRERIRRKLYLRRDEGKACVFGCIEMFYNPKRPHNFSG